MILTSENKLVPMGMHKWSTERRISLKHPPQVCFWTAHKERLPLSVPPVGAAVTAPISHACVSAWTKLMPVSPLKGLWSVCIMLPCTPCLVETLGYVTLALLWLEYQNTDSWGVVAFFYNKVYSAVFAGRTKAAEKLLLFKALSFLQLASASTDTFSCFSCSSAGYLFPVKGMHFSGTEPASGIGLKCYYSCELRRADTCDLKRNTRKMRSQMGERSVSLWAR